MASLPCCEAAAGIRETSVYYTDPKRRKKIERDNRPLTCMKRLWKELQAMSLPDHATQSIWLRYDEETPQYSTALMTGHLDTPYALGLFCFDIYIPNDYPNAPPKVKIVTGRGKARFGPNMYANGKVCLSILGTWPGPQWDPASSNIYQVLISIQTYLLGAQQPWYLEPGFGGWEERIKTNDNDSTKVTRTFRRTGKTTQVELPPKVVGYNNGLRCRTLLFAILDPLQRRGPYAAQQVIVQAHMERNKAALIDVVEQWATELTERPGKNCRDEARFMQSVLDTIVPVLRKSLQGIQTTATVNAEADEGVEEEDASNNNNSEVMAVADYIGPLDDAQTTEEKPAMVDTSASSSNIVEEKKSTSSVVEETKKVNALTKVFASIPWRKQRREISSKPTEESLSSSASSASSDTVFG